MLTRRAVLTGLALAAVPLPALATNFAKPPLGLNPFEHEGHSYVLFPWPLSPAMAEDWKSEGGGLGGPKHDDWDFTFRYISDRNRDRYGSEVHTYFGRVFGTIEQAHIEVWVVRDHDGWTIDMARQEPLRQHLVLK